MTGDDADRPGGERSETTGDADGAPSANETAPATGPDVRTAFELLGDEVRAEILRVLGEARGGGLPPALSFSELRRRLDVDVRSSRFNYHLDRLVGTFLEDRGEGSAQIEADFVADEEGYALRPSGTLLTRQVAAMGTPEDAAGVIAPFDAGIDCHYCDGTLQARYEARTVHVGCPDCGHLYTNTLTPPGLLDGDPDHEALLERADRFLRHKYGAFADGSCPLCANATPPEVIGPGDVDWPDSDRIAALVRRRCTHCGNLNYATLGTELLADPGVVGFRHRQGRDVTAPLLWEIAFVATDRYTTVHGWEPFRATLAVPGDNATLEVDVTVDDGLVVEARREVAGGGD